MEGENPPPRPGNYDRSWNDPPLFSYVSGAQNSGDLRKQGSNRLNKRVEFPSSGGNTSNAKITPLINAQEPPVTSQPAIPPNSLSSNLNASPMPPSMNQEIDCPLQSKTLQVLPYDYKNTSSPYKPIVDSNENVKEIESFASKENVIADLNKVLSNASPAMDSKKENDIRKRIATMEAKWTTNALNTQIENGMAKLAKYLLTAQESIEKTTDDTDSIEMKNLARDSLDEAEKIQRKLMVDWSSICGAWMVGIKHLVQEVKRIVGMKGGLDQLEHFKGIEAPI